MDVISHSHELLEAVLHGVGAGVIAVDESGNCILFNPAADQILGDVRGSDPSTWVQVCGFFKADKITPLVETDSPFFKAMQGESVEKEEIYVRNDRFPMGGWVTVNIRPLHLVDSAQRGGIIIIENITERRRLADDVARSNRDLQQFAYVAAHDLQEPIRSIVGFGELLNKSLENFENPKAQDHLRRILNASKRMQSLIAALLTYARIETRAKAPPECDCDQIVQNIVLDLSSAIKAANAKVEHAKLPRVFADGSQLSQVFANLITNSLKYRSENPVIRISAKSENHMHHFRVADNGIGIDMQFADRIFVIFQRLHNKTEYEGVGIGLALCKKIIENHGGRIWIESKSGEGTEVHFTIPATAKGGING